VTVSRDDISSDDPPRTDLPSARTSAGRKEWIGLAVIALPCLLYAMDLTVLHLAVPSISRDFAPSSAQLLWITDVYGSSSRDSSSRWEPWETGSVGDGFS
jgi:hypothetical protein